MARLVKHRLGNSLGDMVPDGWHMTGETAELVGVSRDTIRRWRKLNIAGPDGFMVVGNGMRIWLYSDIVVANMRALDLKPGRKPNEPVPAA